MLGFFRMLGGIRYARQGQITHECGEQDFLSLTVCVGALNQQHQLFECRNAASNDGVPLVVKAAAWQQGVEVVSDDTLEVFNIRKKRSTHFNHWK